MNRLSAVICTFRRPERLPDAIASLQKQSLPSCNYEIVVVDNSSQDQTEKVVQQFRRDNSFQLRYVVEKRQGLSYARNTAINSATGEIIAFMDDDAVADSGWLESLLEVYDSMPDVWAVGGRILPLWDGMRPRWLKDGMLCKLSIVNWGNEKRPLKWPERIIGTNCSFRRRVFGEVGMFATDLGRRGGLLLGGEETEIQQRIHEVGKRVFYTPKAVVYHHISRERMTKKFFYSRAYGSGRTMAILTLRRGNFIVLLKQVMMSGIELPGCCFGHAWHSLWIREDWLSDSLERLSYHFGFIQEAMKILLRVSFWKKWHEAQQ